MRAVILGACALAVGGALAADLGLGALVALGLAVPAWMGWAMPSRATATLDLAERTLRARADVVVPFDDVRAVRFSTYLRIIWVKLRPRSPRQLWAVDVVTRAGAAVRLAEHPDEYALLQVARRLSNLLGVPLVDACGEEGTLEISEPEPGGARPAGSRPVEADGPVAEVSWEPSCLRSCAGAALPAAGLAAVLAMLAGGAWARYRVALWIAAAALAALLALAARWAAERCVAGVTVGREALALRSRLPLPRRRFRRADVSGVRLSQALLPLVPTEANPEPRLGALCVDLLGARGRLLRISLDRTEALRVRRELERALRATA